MFIPTVLVDLVIQRPQLKVITTEIEMRFVRDVVYSVFPIPLVPLDAHIVRIIAPHVDIRHAGPVPFGIGVQGRALQVLRDEGEVVADSVRFAKELALCLLGEVWVLRRCKEHAHFVKTILNLPELLVSARFAARQRYGVV